MHVLKIIECRVAYSRASGIGCRVVIVHGFRATIFSVLREMIRCLTSLSESGLK
jgi:hypothetical protein